MSMIRGFFIWWGRELAALVPTGLRQRIAAPSPRRILPLEAAPRAPLSGQRRAARTVIGLDRRHALEKRLVLPLAAEREIDRIIAYEMDRETPFSADEVYWQASVETRDRVRGQITVRLALVRKSLIERSLRRFLEAGIQPAALLVPAVPPYEIPLSHETLSPTARLRQLANLPALAACALVLLAVALPFIRQGIALAETDQQIAALTPVADEVAQLRSRLAGNDAETTIGAERAALGDPLTLLAAVTDALPDDTVLTDLALHRRQVSLAGQSAAAAALIGRLAADKAFRAPGFAAPVTRAAGSAAESFAIDVGFAAP
jgi:general secretion pathway protein L